VLLDLLDLLNSSFIISCINPPRSSAVIFPLRRKDYMTADVGRINDSRDDDSQAFDELVSINCGDRLSDRQATINGRADSSKAGNRFLIVFLKEEILIDGGIASGDR